MARFYKDVDCNDFIDLGVVAELVDLHLPDPSLLEFYKRLSKREIFWNQEVDDSMIEVSSHIMKWNQEDKGLSAEERKPIKIFINSNGGDLNTIMNVIDTISLSKTPVITIAMGKAFSAAGYLLMAGHKRYICKNSCCLIHDGYYGTYGSTGKNKDNYEFTEKLEARVREFVLSHTKITEEEYDANYRKDWYLFSDEMIERSIADEIITDIDDIL